MKSYPLEDRLLQSEKNWNSHLGVELGPQSVISNLSRNSKDECVVLVHGFNSNAEEMGWIAKVAHQSGWSSYSLCLPGFANAPIDSNSVTEKDWTMALADVCKLLSTEFRRIKLIGHSFGATLILYYCQAHKQVDHEVLLLAPFLGPYSKVDSTFLKSMSYLFDSVSFKFLYALSHNPDLKSLMSSPERFGTQFPLKSVRKVIRMGEQLNIFKDLAHVKGMILHSECDKAVNVERIDELIRHNFNFTLKRWPLDSRLNHQFEIEGKKDSKEVIKSIEAFLLQ